MALADDFAEALAGRGLAGDRYERGEGTFSAPGRGAHPGLLRPLVRRGGLRADVLTGSLISIGDEIARVAD